MNKLDTRTGRHIPKSVRRNFSVKFSGGLYLDTDQYDLPPGACVDASNYEIGRQKAKKTAYYRIMDGYARVDSLAPGNSFAYRSYFRLGYQQQTSSVPPAVGDTISFYRGIETQARGIVINKEVTSGGGMGTLETGFISVAPINELSFFDSSENPLPFRSSGQFVNNLVWSEPVQNYWDGINVTNHNTAASGAFSALYGGVQPVPGVGAVKGVNVFKGKIYAIRFDPATGSDEIYRSSYNNPAGWERIEAKAQLSFINGTHGFNTQSVRIPAPLVARGVTSGATADITSNGVTRGAWFSTAETGYFSLDNIVGGPFQAGEQVEVDFGFNNIPSGVFVPVGEIRYFAEGGESLGNSPTRYDWEIFNFFADEKLERLFLAGGGGRAFMIAPDEFSDDSMIPIRSNEDDDLDKPSFIIEHKFHLFLGFDDGRVVHSNLGEPLLYNNETALEFGIGSSVTGFAKEVGDVLAIFGRQKTALLYGTGASAGAVVWDLREHSEKVGAIPYTVQRMGNVVHADDYGITSLSATEKYGDFNQNSISEHVAPYWIAQKDEVVCSVRVREKNQYRIFFTKGRGISVTFSKNDVLGIMPFEYDHQVNCAISGTLANGDEVLLAGFTDGYVKRLDYGASFDGLEIPHHLTLPASGLGISASMHIHKARLRSTGKPDLTLKFVSESEAGQYVEGPDIISYAEKGSSNYMSDLTGEGVSQHKYTSNYSLTATGFRNGWKFRGLRYGEDSHTLHTLDLTYSPRTSRQ